MKSLRTTLVSIATLAAGLAMSGGAFAQSTWNVYSAGSGGCTQNASKSGTFNNSWNCSGTGTAGTAVTASAWSSDRGTGANALSGTGFASSYMSAQGNSGFGAASRTEGIGAQAPDHSFDSYNPGTMDALLLDFGATSVILDKIGIGWTNGDADITVMRWTGAVAPTRTTGASSLAGDGEQNLTSNLYNPASPGTAGWQLVGSYADLLGDNTAPFGGSARSTGASQASSWWLISTFNTALNGNSNSCLAANGTTTTCDAGQDSFKLNYIATKNPGTTQPSGGKVPEPGSLALAGVALAGVFGIRRRSAKQA